jgi:serine protease AprX
VYTDQKLTVLSAASMSSPNPGPSIIDDPREISGPKGEGVTVALIDTGADADHEALSRKIVAFQDFVNNQTEPYDDNGHGTHCASLIAGDLGMGVAPGAELVVIKVMDRDGACYLSDALKALDWCLDNRDRYGIKIISFSVGGEGPSDGASLLDEACDRMVEEGLTMCVAAGNSGPSPSSIVMPGGAEKVITIGAIDRTGLIFEQSSRGPTLTGEIKPDLVTLGVDVPSALAGSKNGLSSVSGTSMAVPQVSGASAVLLEANPELQPADIKRLLLKTADELGQEGKDNLYGYGALNLTRALRSINAPKEELYPPDLVDVRLNRDEATEGEPVMVEAQASGEIKSLNTKIIGPDRNLEIPMDDLDGNGIYSARWETSFWTAGDYKISVDLVGGFGEMESIAVPFRLLER